MGEAKKKSGSRWGKLFGVLGTNLSQLNLKEDENVPSDLHHDAVSQLPAKETAPTLIQTSTELEDELALKQENDSVPPLRVYGNGTSKSQNGHASHDSANASSTTNGSSSSPKLPSNGHAEAANITNITASMAGNISPMLTSSAENEQFLSFGTANKSKPIAPHTQSVTEDNLKKVNSSLLSANHAPPLARATSAPKRPSPTTSRSPSHGPSSKQTSPPPLSNLNGSNTALQVHLLSHPNKSNPPSRSSSTKLGKANIASAPSSASISNMSGSTAASVLKPRFKMLENGNHEHNLRCAKRQEKLSNMLKDLLGAQKLRDEAKSAVPNILLGTIRPSAANNQNKPPTLFAGLVNHVKNNTSPYHGGPSAFNAAAPLSSTVNVTSTVTYSTKDAEQEANEKLVHQSSSIGTNVGFTPLQDSRSFVEKYGRCNEVIGRGSFGVVRISHKKITGTGASNVSIQSSSQISSSGTAGQPNDEILYAVKEFKRKTQESDKKYNRRLTLEFCISSSLKHPNIIETLDLLKDAKGDYCEVMEYCSGGDLYTLIIALGKLEYAEADCFFKQLIRGVNYMHDMGVSHRDLKPENILLTQSGMVKITDFGNGECFRMAWEEEVQLSEGVCGSSPYIAPEEFTQQQFDPRCVDIWACGVIYMAMRTGRQLWKLANPKKDEFFEEYLEKRKDATGYEPIENLKRARCRNVIYSILDPKPDRRITGKQILNSEWGREIKVCSAGDDH